MTERKRKNIVMTDSKTIDAETPKTRLEDELAKSQGKLSLLEGIRVFGGRVEKNFFFLGDVRRLENLAAKIPLTGEAAGEELPAEPFSDEFVFPSASVAQSPASSAVSNSLHVRGASVDYPFLVKEAISKSEFAVAADNVDRVVDGFVPVTSNFGGTTLTVDAIVTEKNFDVKNVYQKTWQSHNRFAIEVPPGFFSSQVAGADDSALGSSQNFRIDAPTRDAADDLVPVFDFSSMFGVYVEPNVLSCDFGQFASSGPLFATTVLPPLPIRGSSFLLQRSGSAV